jgi:OOP family OmpA-OmpF porin
MLNASSESRLGINAGVVSIKNSDGSHFDNQTFGATLQYNNYVVMPRFDLEYVKIKDERASSFLKGSINGVYEFQKNSIVPYVLAGAGYESVQGETKDVLESHPFVQGGGGFSVDLFQDTKVNLEGKYLQVIGGKDEENEVIVTAGVSITLGGKKVVKKRVVRKKIVKKIVRPKPKPRIIYVSNNECSIKIDLPDLDRDGVEDRLDQCPNTPCDFNVDSYGCPIKTTLKVNFKSGSSDITTLSMSKIDRFANFLLKNKGSRVKIVGHTDSFGSQKDNLLLSQRRAYAIVRSLIKRGVSAGRLFAEGRGESMPIASNKTLEGRAINRRIEAELTYMRGRK